MQHEIYPFALGPEINLVGLSVFSFHKDMKGRDLKLVLAELINSNRIFPFKFISK